MERTFSVPSGFFGVPRPEGNLSLTEFLCELGVPPNLSGFRYIKDALELLLARDDATEHAISKLIYPELAAKYGRSRPSIEKAIRTAIEATWVRGPERIRWKIFRNTLKNFNTRPTNTEFLSTLANYLSGWDFSMVAES